VDGLDGFKFLRLIQIIVVLGIRHQSCMDSQLRPGQDNQSESSRMVCNLKIKTVSSFLDDQTATSYMYT
jgi:hypothetical protein